MRKAVMFLILSAVPAIADVVGPGGKTVDCFCTDGQGARVELGETICLTVGGRAYMALCDMSLNVPTWRDTGQGCLSSELERSPTERVFHLLKPAVEPAGISRPVGPES